MELVGIAGDDVDPIGWDAELLGGDLGQHGEVPLPLGPDSRGDRDPAVGVHLHPGALVGSDAGAFDVGDHANADMTAFGTQAGLLVVDERLVVDELQRLVENGLVVAAVVHQRREVLIEDLVIVREVLRVEEVPPADLDGGEAELIGGEVEQALDHEDAVLASRAAVGSDECLGREDRGELALVGRHVVRGPWRCTGC